ncbi:MAG: YfhO family protein [Eubacteriales bacterium]|nr:YfhO family protein [Eubacteriales bacterium]
MLVYLLAVLPFLIKKNGLFFYYGDYNVQQVPFLIFAHRAVRQGKLFWNPMVDLGGSMTGNFAFYLWGSPFFWLTIPFPEAWLPYMMPFLMALKYGTAAAASFAWIRTQTKTDRAALCGAFLYAFSGFQACNIVFQHFHDVTAFFPLYLLAFDRFIQRGDLSAVSGGIVKNDCFRRARAFAVMTALMSIINYYFFFGQVLFLFLYYMVRWGIRRARGEGLPAFLSEVLRILMAGAAGLLLSSFFLVQSISGILGNTRVSRVLSGYDLVAYPDSTTPLAILKSFFMVPDLIARGTLFSSDHIRNGSLAFYLPCLAMTGVFAFWQLRGKSWKKTLLTILCAMAFVPVLCAAFSAMNSNFYTRWFYMPVLLCACMTAEVLEEEESAAFHRGAWLSLACTALFLLMCYLPVKENGKWSFTAICQNRKLLMIQFRATLYGAVLLLGVMILKHRRPALWGKESRVPADGKGNPAQKEESPEPENNAQVSPGTAAQAETLPEDPAGTAAQEKTLPEDASRAGAADDRGRPRIPAGRGLFTAGNLCIVLLLTACIGTTMAVLHNGSSLISRKGFEKWKRQMLTERPSLQAEEEDAPVSMSYMPGDENNSLSGGSGNPETGTPFSRVETDGTSTNYEMVWGYPTMHCFESTVHPSIFTWYRGIGMIRTVESTLPLERIGARAVMSVRYYIENTLVKPDKSYTDQGGMDGYTLINDKNGYNVYETENYLPMGFSFDSYMTEENYKLLENGKISDRVLVKDLILSKEMAEKYGSLMTEDTDTDPGIMSYSSFYECCRERRKTACTSFQFQKNGWNAVARMEKDNLVFFSIPYDEGFHVTVDGTPTKLERADYGLCAVFVPAGTHEIKATYMPVGFVPCFAISALTALVLAAWPVAARAAARR